MHANVKTPPHIKSRVTIMPGKRAATQQGASALLFLSTTEGTWQQLTYILPSGCCLMLAQKSMQSSFSTEGKANKYQPSPTGLLTTHTFQEIPSRCSRRLLLIAQRALQKRCGQPLPCCFSAHSKNERKKTTPR